MKILLVSRVSPVPAVKGGAQRTYLLYKALQEVAEVDLLLLHSPECLNREDVSQLETEFSLKGCFALSEPSDGTIWSGLPLSKKWKNCIAHNISGGRNLYSSDTKVANRFRKEIDVDEYDLIVGRYAKSISALGLTDTELSKVALDIDDWDLDRLRNRVSNSKSPIDRWRSRWHLSNVERVVGSFLDSIGSVWVANRSNCKEPHLKDSIYLPNIPFDLGRRARGVLPFSTEESVMTIGSFSYSPNVEGVDWFLSTVWPLVVKIRPNAKFRIFGSSLDHRIKERWSSEKGVEVSGFVESVGDAYRVSRMSICPVQNGAGTNIKILESLAFGRMCISTEVGSRGFGDLVESGALLVAKDSERMAQEIANHLGNDMSYRRLGMKGNAIVDRNYSFRTFQNAVEAGIARVVYKRGKRKCVELV